MKKTIIMRIKYGENEKDKFYPNAYGDYDGFLSLPWGNEDTKQIIEILKKHNVKVTFFMTGGWVEKYPDDVKMILAEGHDLGNHSENHKNMSQLSDSEKESELMKVHEKVKNLTGYEMFLFRPPYGETRMR